jgi:uncharacterized protein YceH (UPF0502 family)
VRLASGPGSRASKYRQLFDEALHLDGEETALLAVLMLRGPQTPGELKGRTERLHRFESVAAVQSALERLIEREYAARLPRRPGQKEERYMQLLGGAEPPPGEVVADDDSSQGPALAPGQPPPPLERLTRLEAELAALREDVRELREALGEPSRPQS